MKNILLFILSSLFLLPCFAQEQFEGTIVYKLHSTEEKMANPELTILFGKNAVRVKFKEKQEADMSELLIRIDSGKVYNINYKDKTYHAKKLMETKKSSLEMLNPRNIAGYGTTALGIGNGHPLNRVFGIFYQNSEVVLYVADDLYFTIPEKYMQARELMFVSNNKIILGATATADMRAMMDDDMPEEDILEKDPGKRITTISAEAISVTRETIDEKEFLIPADFVKGNFLGSTDSVSVMIDSMLMLDTMAGIPDTIQPALKKPATQPANKTKQPTKPKTSSTKKGELRKPE